MNPEPRTGRTPPDLRAVVLGLMAWAGGLGAFLLPGWLLAAVLGAAGGVLLLRWSRGRRVVTGVAWLAATTAVAAAALWRVEAVQRSDLARLAAEGAFVTATVRVTGDPVRREGTYGPYVLLRAQTLEVVGRGARHSGQLPVLVIGEPSWQRVRLGAEVVLEGRAQPADGDDLAAVLTTQRPPRLRAPPGEVLDAAAAGRAGIRRAVSGAGAAERELVPALVVGDDQGLPPALVADFEVAGLTHLTAVSGTNLTLVVGFVMVLARWAGVRGRWLVVVGLLGVAGFVLMARTEPSVVRAAAMGSVALIGLGTGGRERGVRALGVAVWALLLLDPWMALSIGFALSSLATAGILFLAPPCRDALAVWMPRWLAEAVAVPLAAQLACTPLVAAVSGQVSLVALVANMLVAPAVGPATVLGLAGGFVVLAVEPLGMALGRLSGWCAWWIVAVAEQSADLPTAAVGWPAGPLPLILLTLLCVVIGWALPALLDRRRWVLPLALVMVLVVVRPLPTPGWPPPGWVMVMCDVGQGDGLVLNGGPTGVVVVDTGPDPELIDACLDRLEVERVATVVLSHFHADHVGGLPGVFADRPPARLLVTGFAEPTENAAEVRAQAARAGVPVRVPDVGTLLRVGSLTLQVLGPAGGFATGTAPAEGSPANNASLTLLARARGVRILLPGDSEPEAQDQLAHRFPHLRVDVLKVPHHGSSYQSTEFLTGLDARVALVPVGAANSYGHPSPRILDLLEDTGAVVRRTDRAGDVAVVVGAGGQLTLRELSTSSSAMR